MSLELPPHLRSRLQGYAGRERLEERHRSRFDFRSSTSERPLEAYQREGYSHPGHEERLERASLHLHHKDVKDSKSRQNSNGVHHPCDQHPASTQHPPHASSHLDGQLRQSLPLPFAEGAPLADTGRLVAALSPSATYIPSGKHASRLSLGGTSLRRATQHAAEAVNREVHMEATAAQPKRKRSEAQRDHLPSKLAKTELGTQPAGEFHPTVMQSRQQQASASARDSSSKAAMRPLTPQLEVQRQSNSTDAQQQSKAGTILFVKVPQKPTAEVEQLKLVAGKKVKIKHPSSGLVQQDTEAARSNTKLDGSQKSTEPSAAGSSKQQSSLQPAVIFKKSATGELQQVTSSKPVKQRTPPVSPTPPAKALKIPPPTLEDGELVDNRDTKSMPPPPPVEKVQQGGLGVDKHKGRQESRSSTNLAGFLVKQADAALPPSPKPPKDESKQLGHHAKTDNKQAPQVGGQPASSRPSDPKRRSGQPDSVSHQQPSRSEQATKPALEPAAPVHETKPEAGAKGKLPSSDKQAGDAYRAASVHGVDGQARGTSTAAKVDSSSSGGKTGDTRSGRDPQAQVHKTDKGKHSSADASQQHDQPLSSQTLNNICAKPRSRQAENSVDATAGSISKTGKESVNARVRSSDKLGKDSNGAVVRSSDKTGKHRVDAVAGSTDKTGKGSVDAVAGSKDKTGKGSVDTVAGGSDKTGKNNVGAVSHSSDRTGKDSISAVARSGDKTGRESVGAKLPKGDNLAKDSLDAKPSSSNRTAKDCIPPKPPSYKQPQDSVVSKPASADGSCDKVGKPLDGKAGSRDKTSRQPNANGLESTSLQDHSSNSKEGDRQHRSKPESHNKAVAAGDPATAASNAATAAGGSSAEHSPSSQQKARLSTSQLEVSGIDHKAAKPTLIDDKQGSNKKKSDSHNKQPAQSSKFNDQVTSIVAEKDSSGSHHQQPDSLGGSRSKRMHDSTKHTQQHPSHRTSESGRQRSRSRSRSHGRTHCQQQHSRSHNDHGRRSPTLRHDHSPGKHRSRSPTVKRSSSRDVHRSRSPARRHSHSPQRVAANNLRQSFNSHSRPSLHQQSKDHLQQSKYAVGLSEDLPQQFKSQSNQLPKDHTLATNKSSQQLTTGAKGNVTAEQHASLSHQSDIQRETAEGELDFVPLVEEDGHGGKDDTADVHKNESRSVGNGVKSQSRGSRELGKVGSSTHRNRGGSKILELVNVDGGSVAVDQQQLGPAPLKDEDMVKSKGVGHALSNSSQPHTSLQVAPVAQLETTDLRTSDPSGGYPNTQKDPAPVSALALSESNQESTHTQAEPTATDASEVPGLATTQSVPTVSAASQGQLQSSAGPPHLPASSQQPQHQSAASVITDMQPSKAASQANLQQGTASFAQSNQLDTKAANPQTAALVGTANAPQQTSLALTEAPPAPPIVAVASVHQLTAASADAVPPPRSVDISSDQPHTAAPPATSQSLTALLGTQQPFNPTLPPLTAGNMQQAWPIILPSLSGNVHHPLPIISPNNLSQDAISQLLAPFIQPSFQAPQPQPNQQPLVVGNLSVPIGSLGLTIGSSATSLPASNSIAGHSTVSSFVMPIPSAWVGNAGTSTTANALVGSAGVGMAPQQFSNIGLPPPPTGGGRFGTGLRIGHTQTHQLGHLLQPQQHLLPAAHAMLQPPLPQPQLPQPQLPAQHVQLQLVAYGQGQPVHALPAQQTVTSLHSHAQVPGQQVQLPSASCTVLATQHGQLPGQHANMPDQPGQLPAASYSHIPGQQLVMSSNVSQPSLLQATFPSQVPAAATHPKQPSSHPWSVAPALTQHPGPGSIVTGYMQDVSWHSAPLYSQTTSLPPRSGQGSVHFSQQPAAESYAAQQLPWRTQPAVQQQSAVQTQSTQLITSSQPSASRRDPRMQPMQPQAQTPAAPQFGAHAPGHAMPLLSAVQTQGSEMLYQGEQVAMRTWDSVMPSASGQAADVLQQQPGIAQGSTLDDHNTTDHHNQTLPTQSLWPASAHQRQHTGSNPAIPFDNAQPSAYPSMPPSDPAELTVTATDSDAVAYDPMNPSPQDSPQLLIHDQPKHRVSEPNACAGSLSMRLHVQPVGSQPLPENHTRSNGLIDGQAHTAVFQGSASTVDNAHTLAAMSQQLREPTPCTSRMAHVLSSRTVTAEQPHGAPWLHTGRAVAGDADEHVAPAVTGQDLPTRATDEDLPAGGIHQDSAQAPQIIGTAAASANQGAGGGVSNQAPGQDSAQPGVTAHIAVVPDADAITKRMLQLLQDYMVQ